MFSTITYKFEGFYKIFDPTSGEIFQDKKNSIHYENMSEALALAAANRGTGFIYELEFGNGGTSVDPTGVISYLPPNTNSQTDQLYNTTYSKIVDDTSTYNLYPSKNKMEVRHVPGKNYTDILITCLLDYGEPLDQAAFDNSQNLDGNYVFDEIGLKGYSSAGPGTGKLLTHAIFHPVQKSLNRLIQIDYTIRISALTTLTSTV